MDARRFLSSLLLALCLSLDGSALFARQAPEAPAQPPQATTPPADAPPAAETAAQPPADPSQAPPAEPPLPQPGEDTSGSLPGTTGEPAKPPAAPAAPAVPAIPGAGENRISFQLKFPPDKDGKGGGNAAGSAGSLEYQRDDYAVLSGGVKIRYQDVEIEAEQAEIALDTKVVTATGKVVVDQGPRRMTGETMEYDLDTKTGKLTNATAQVSPDYYFTGAEVAKIGEDLYTVNDGIFTSCSQKVPDWSFKLSRAQIEQEGYAHVRGASMRAKGIPVFYTPYILWPTKSERSSGFLVPNIGYSDIRGAYLGLAYFQTLGRSYDTTFHFDTYTQGYYGVGNEFRYRPSEGTKGDLLGYLIRDPESTEDWRWKVEWSHATSDLPRGMRGGIQFQEYSDFDFFRDFERDFDRNTLRFIDSRAFVSGNWGPHLLNLQLNSRETFIDEGATVDQRKLPELEYRLRSTRIGKSPFYAQFQGSTSYLDISRPGSYSGQFGRIDAFPQLSLPIRSFPWLSVSLTGGERLTYYSDSLDATGQTFSGEALTRALPFGSAQIVGPSFSRIIQKEIGDFGKFKHVIEPRLTYTYLGEFDELIEVPLFDEVDRPFSTNSGRFALVNRVLGKPKDEKQGSARETFNVEIARAVSFDDDQPLEVSAINPLIRSNAGPLETLLRWNPSDKLTLRAQVDYSLLFSGLSSTQLSGNVGFGKGNLAGLTWFTRFRPEQDVTLFNQLRFNGAVSILPRKLRLEGQINYDVELGLLQQQRYILNWTSQCYGIRLEMRDFRAGEGPRLRDKDFRFSLSLKNVGTFLDMTSRSSNQEP